MSTNCTQCHATVPRPTLIYIGPTITDVNPKFGPTSGGTTITITGSNFGATDSNPSATLGGVAASSCTWVSNTEMQCDSPNAEQVVFTDYRVVVSVASQLSNEQTSHTFVYTGVSWSLGD